MTFVSDPAERSEEQCAYTDVALPPAVYDFLARRNVPSVIRYAS